MAKLPSSFRGHNRTTERFRQQYAKLPPSIQNRVRELCLLFDRDPAHPSLRRHTLHDNRKGQHVPGSESISVTMQYRALFVEVDGMNIWYWIGTRADYDEFVGS
jgi:hypothetical protein